VPLYPIFSGLFEERKIGSASDKKRTPFFFAFKTLSTLRNRCPIANITRRKNDTDLSTEQHGRPVRACQETASHFLAWNEEAFKETVKLALNHRLTIRYARSRRMVKSLAKRALILGRRRITCGAVRRQKIFLHRVISLEIHIASRNPLFLPRLEKSF